MYFEQSQLVKQSERAGLAASGGTAAQGGAETLASVTPRIMQLAEKVANGSQHIATSLGLVDNIPSSSDRDAPLTLMQALRAVENALDFALARLDTINQHING